MGQAEIAGIEPAVGGLVHRLDWINAGCTRREVAHISENIGQVVGAIIAEVSADVRGCRSVTGWSLDVGIDDEIVGNGNIDAQVAIRVACLCRPCECKHSHDHQD